MRRKRESCQGFTLVEMLAAAVILILLGLMLNTGIQMAMRTYRSLVAHSELELLVSTAVDALADDLRYAQNVSGTDENFSYTSDSFGADTRFSIDSNEDSPSWGQILANGKRVLSTGAYGLERAYQVEDLSVVPAVDGTSGEITFTIKLTVTTRDGSISVSTPAEGVNVRCLNRNPVDPPAGGETTP